MTARGRSRLKILVVVPAGVFLMVGLASAYWSAGSDAGGNGASAATSVNTGATPTASAIGSAVTVDWAARTLASGQAVSGYVIKRYRASDLQLQTILSACNVPITGLTCTENSVPSGSWRYTTTPVIGTNWVGTESAMSTTLIMDAVPPTNSITRNVVTGTSGMVGNTIYYRGTVAGSFTLTNAVADAESGPYSSATAALGGTTTGWTHSPSTVLTPSNGPYVSNVFSWGASTTSAPTELVTGRDVAGNTVGTTLTFTNDSTQPTAGTVTYANTYQPGMSVPVTFTTGTDTGGSGIGTRQLQRQTAPLTAADTCVTWSGYTNIGPVNPTSIYTDFAVANGTCYMYQYVVTDVAGNVRTVTGTDVSRVDYAGAVFNTTGALSHWRLGEATATLGSSDSFNGTNGALLTARSGEIGATWLNPSGNANMLIGTENRAYRNASGYSIMHTTATPASADYSVEADLYYKGTFASIAGGVIGRFNTTSTSFYMARWENDETWNIVKWSSGAPAWLNTSAVQPNLTVGQTYRLKLTMTGSSLQLYVNGVLRASATDATITAAGKAGIMAGEATDAAQTDSTGIQFENFQVTPSTYPRAADSKGTNTGDHKNGVGLGAADALTGDADTAATFDGVNDYVQVIGSTGLPTGAGIRSVEAWFKTSSSTRQVLFHYGSRANTQEFGLWLEASGTTMTAWGFGGGNDLAFTMPAAVNNGQWHQVIKTYNGTAITIYIDGVALTSQAATRATTMDQYGFGIGAVINPSDGNSGGFFNGSIDEVSFYTTALSQTTVTNHYQLGTSTQATDLTGPTGGSIDATSLVGTGARYAASLTLSLTLAKGTDPSGVATTGNEVQRATATLISGGTADGVCGTYGSYTLVTGGTDPTSPLADTVTDQACYSYKYIVQDTLGNSTTYTSPDIKVDLTASSAPALTFGTFTNTYWSTGGTVYYRSAAAAGSFTATGTASDTASGIASFAFPTLGTNWTSTPGSLGVNTYSWSGAPQIPGAKNVTATNNATVLSGTTAFTPTADDTAPTAGTVTYTDGVQASTAVNVGFTTGTDGGSGVGTRLLQRAEVALTGTTCGSPYGSFATISGGTNPASSPVADTVTTGKCYKYQYLVPDRVGNQHIASSANVLKIQSYAAAVNTTSGMLSHWRLGESGATVANDTFTGTDGTTLLSHPANSGQAWDYWYGTDNEQIISNRITSTDAGRAIYTLLVTPTSPNYAVEADVYYRGVLAGDMTGVIGRATEGISTTTTFYVARYMQSDQSWNIVKNTGTTPTNLGKLATQPLTVGQTYNLRLEMTGTTTTTLRLFVDDVLKVSATDSSSPFTVVGRAGIMEGENASATVKSTSAGLHLDNFKVFNLRTVDSGGTNHGAYVNGTTVPVAGALAGDADTAAQFDGLDDYASVPRQISDNFSIEFWFKSTQGIGTDNFWYNGAGLVDAEVSGSANDFGVSLRSDGRVKAGVGPGAGTTIVSSLGGYNDGNWHQIVFTRTMSSGALALYVDGAAAASGTGSTVSLTSSADLNFGRIASGVNQLIGSLDEVSVYSSVLDSGTVGNHYAQGTGGPAGDYAGPTGGSIDASGLVGTGSRYAPSLTLSLTLAKGTDPAGVAPTGATVTRATATLTSTAGANGVCGTYGSYTLISGGSDPTSPKSDTVTDQACYSYKYLVADTLGNPTTYTSPDIKVDLTASAAPTLTFGTFSNTYWSTGGTVYYRSTAASGSVTATGTATDGVSGIASFAFPALGTNWVSTPGALGVNTYSWSAAPAVPGIKTVTATNNATVVSGTTSFTPTADDTAPSAGTVTYTDTTQATLTISVGFTTGTDGGSGLGAKLLQRQSATLTGGTCGSYGSFATIALGTNPASSPVVDTVTAGFCYKYQYLVTDNVGNFHAATSANVVKVSTGTAYYDAVWATTGLINYYRLGENVISSDAMSGTAGATLQSRNGAIGAAWTKHAASSADAVITAAGRVRKTGTSVGALYYASGVPATADYTVEADIFVASTLTNDMAGVVGRADTSATTFYLVRYQQVTQTWVIYMVQNNTWTWLNQSATQALTVGATYRVALDLTGTTIRALVDGVQVVSVTDGTLTGIGRGGIALGFDSVASTTVTDSTGLHLDNFRITPPLVDSKGTNHGDYLADVGLGNAGALSESDTAVLFDGINDYGIITRQISTDFSIQFWFKAPNDGGEGATEGMAWPNYAGLVDSSLTGTNSDFGITLSQGGVVYAGVGGGGGDVTIRSVAGGYDDNQWHYVVMTRTGTTFKLYVDGAAVVNGTGANGAALTASNTITFGRNDKGATTLRYYNGYLDEIAFYNVVLTPTQVAAHFAAR